MTRSSIWIGVVSFVLAMLMSFSIDLAGRDVALSGISLGGLPAFAKDRRGGGLQIELPSALEALSELSEAAEAAEAAGDADDGDDDEGPDDDGGDDN
jgi:hypothetical protein